MHIVDDLLIGGSNGTVTKNLTPSSTSLVISENDEDQSSIGWNMTDKEYGLLGFVASVFVYLMTQVN